MVGFNGAARTSALSASVLVLNRLYQPVHVVDVKRAFALLCRNLAEVVHIEEGIFGNYDFETWLELSQMRSESKDPCDDWIQSVAFEIEVPRVMRLVVFDRVPKHVVRLNRHTIFARDEHRCQYCGKRFPHSQLSLDHVMPRSRGGDTSWENVVCACLRCNVRKGGRTPQEARMKLRTKPVRPARSPLLMMKLRNPKYASWRTWLEPHVSEAAS